MKDEIVTRDRQWLEFALPFVPAVFLLCGVELIVRMGWVPPYLVPTPSSVIKTFGNRPGELWRACGETALAAGGGFLLSVTVGLIVAVSLSAARWVRLAFYPYAVFFQTVPIVAVAPLLVIWIGYGIETVVATSFIVSVFPVIAASLTGLLSTEPALRDMFKLYRASSTATLFKLRLPATLPQILTGMRVAAGLSVIGAIVGEFITGSGIGGVVQVTIARQDTPRIFALLLLCTGLGVLLFAVVNALSYLLLRHWHASERHGR